jgi:hypothetical protein
MTFRPSDDVLDEVMSGQNNLSTSQYNVEKQEENQISFGGIENQTTESPDFPKNSQES